MDLYYQDDDGADGWLQPIKHEHFDVEKNDPMTAELEHFVDLCSGMRDTTPRCTGDNALDTLKVINATQKSAERRNSGEALSLLSGVRPSLYRALRQSMAIAPPGLPPDKPGRELPPFQISLLPLGFQHP